MRVTPRELVAELAQGRRWPQGSHPTAQRLWPHRHLCRATPGNQLAFPHHPLGAVNSLQRCAPRSSGPELLSDAINRTVGPSRDSSSYTRELVGQARKGPAGDDTRRGPVRLSRSARGSVIGVYVGVYADYRAAIRRALTRRPRPCLRCPHYLSSTPWPAPQRKSIQAGGQRRDRTRSEASRARGDSS